MSFEFEIEKKCSHSAARVGKLSTPHGDIETPMPKPGKSNAVICSMLNLRRSEYIPPCTMPNNAWRCESTCAFTQRSNHRVVRSKEFFVYVRSAV